MAANQQFVDVQSAARTQEVIDTTAAKATYELTLAGLGQEIAEAQSIYDVAFAMAQDAVFFAGLFPVPDSSTLWDTVTFVGAFVGSVALGLGVAFTIAALSGPCAIAAGWGGTILVGGLIGIMLINFATATMNRLADGQSLVGAASGGLADVTPVSPIWRGATGTDIVTGANLHLTSNDRAAELGGGLGAIAAMVFGGAAARAGSRFAPGCFVAGTQVIVTADGKEELVVVNVVANAGAEPDAQQSIVLAAACIAIGTVGFAGLLSRKRRKLRDNSRWAAVDACLREQLIEGKHSTAWTVADLEPTLIERQLGLSADQATEEAVWGAISWDDDVDSGLPTADGDGNLAGLNARPITRATKPLQERVKVARRQQIMPRTSEKTSSLRAALPWLWLAAFLCCAACFLGRVPGLSSAGTSRDTTAVAQKTPRTANIEQIRVGRRVAAQLPAELLDKAIGNPNIVPAWDALDAQIDSATWRRIVLVMQGEVNSRFDIELLRPLSWLQETNARNGGSIHLELTEMGLDGPAEVLAIAPCPPIPSGSGRVVTGTSTHVRGRIVNVYVDGQTEPLRVTENHPVYSVRHNDFVPAGELQPGDHLRKLDGRVVAVSSIAPLPGEQRVFNLEVQGKHVYRVISDGLLVHNACARTYANLLPEAQAKYPNKAGTIESHHITPQYMGGAKNGTKADIDAAYHQWITNAFRREHPYGSPKPNPEQLSEIMATVYNLFPLPE